jgi:lipooligosaccharide transport system ATP-binding protein
MDDKRARAITAKEIKKAYRGVAAIKGLSLDIEVGECFGLLGPNGAGKTTLLKMIYGQAIPSSGEMFVLGLNIKTQMTEIKRRLGIVPQDDGLDTDFSALENLHLHGIYHGLSREERQTRTEQLLAEMRLAEQRHQHVEELSGGMRRRLVIARALLNNPQLLILDEPTTGLDPQARLWIWTYFERLKLQKTTMILTTHYMEEAERLCDRIAIIDHGEVLDIGTARELIKKHIGKEVVEITVGAEKTYWINQVRSKGLAFQEYEEKIFVYFASSEERQKFLTNIQNTYYLIRSANLNDVFLKLAGYQIRGDA